MAAYDVKLLTQEVIAKDTLASYLEKPAGFEFKAGQSLDITIKEMHPFSIASAPHEPRLLFVTRLRESVFKRALRELEPGALIHIEGPFGAMTLHEEISRPAIFLAGGIGITLFRSMVLDATERGLPHELYLFHSSRTEEEAAFLEELRRLENPHFHFLPTMTRAGGQRLDASTLKEHVPDVKKAVGYITGPPAFIGAMRRALEEAGVHPDRIRFEEFSGY